jgi:hypothetical protein
MEYQIRIVGIGRPWGMTHQEAEEKIISIDCQKCNYMFGGVSYAE